MKVKVTSVEVKANGKVWIGFDCAYGKGEALWFGPHPASDASYDVELGIPTEVKDGKNLFKTQENTPYISTMPGKSIIRGYVKSIDGKLMVLCVGETIVLIETSEEYQLIGATVKIEAPYLEMYDTAI